VAARRRGCPTQAGRPRAVSSSHQSTLNLCRAFVASRGQRRASKRPRRSSPICCLRRSAVRGHWSRCQAVSLSAMKCRLTRGNEGVTATECRQEPWSAATCGTSMTARRRWGAHLGRWTFAKTMPDLPHEYISGIGYEEAVLVTGLPAVRSWEPPSQHRGIRCAGSSRRSPPGCRSHGRSAHRLRRGRHGPRGRAGKRPRRHEAELPCLTRPSEHSPQRLPRTDAVA